MGTPLISSSLAVESQSSLSKIREDKMLRQMRSGKAGNDDASLEKGAKEFESMLLSSWLQQAEQSMATVPGAEDDENTAGRDQMIGLGVQSLANSLVASGGIGIAGMISRALHRARDGAGHPGVLTVRSEAVHVEK